MRRAIDINEILIVNHHAQSAAQGGRRGEGERGGAGSHTADGTKETYTITKKHAVHWCKRDDVVRPHRFDDARWHTLGVVPNSRSSVRTHCRRSTMCCIETNVLPLRVDVLCPARRATGLLQLGGRGRGSIGSNRHWIKTTVDPPNTRKFTCLTVSNHLGRPDQARLRLVRPDPARCTLGPCRGYVRCPPLDEFSWPQRRARRFRGGGRRGSCRTFKRSSSAQLPPGRPWSSVPVSSGISHHPSATMGQPPAHHSGQDLPHYSSLPSVFP